MADRDQTLGYQRRKRTRGMRTNTSELFRTASRPSGALVTATLFPYRTGDVTFAFELSIDDVAPSGVPLVIGSATTQITVTISGTDLVFHAGSAAGDGVTVTATGVLNGQRNYKIVIATRTATGQARMWIDGRLVARGTSAGGGFPAGWADSTSGSYGTGLTDASVVGPLSVYMKQLPRQFNESLYA